LVDKEKQSGTTLPQECCSVVTPAIARAGSERERAGRVGEWSDGTEELSHGRTFVVRFNQRFGQSTQQGSRHQTFDKVCLSMSCNDIICHFFHFF
jgi:hypothetical protein